MMAEKSIYRASIVHTEATIEKMYITQYHEYDKLKMLLRFLCGIGVILFAVFCAIPTWLRAILLLIGAWLVSTGDFPARMKADKVAQARNGKYPVMHYSFFEKDMRLSGEGSMNLSYDKFTKLVSSGKYLFLFVSRESVCMIDTSTLQPSSVEDFKKFVAEKTNLKWTVESSLVSLNLYDLKDMFSEKKQDRTYVGKRLK